jgi:hypothetical protein
MTAEADVAEAVWPRRMMFLGSSNSRLVLMRWRWLRSSDIEVSARGVPQARSQPVLIFSDDMLSPVLTDCPSS